MSGDFEKLELSDAEIETLRTDRANAWVRYKSWKDERFEIEFRDVLGLEAFNPEGKELSHGSIETSGAFLERACNEAEEPVSSYRCFVFWSASPVRPILRIVAAGFEEERVHAA